MMIDVVCLGQVQLPPTLMFVGMRNRVHLVKQMRLVGNGWFGKLRINHDFVIGQHIPYIEGYDKVGTVIKRRIKSLHPSFNARNII